MSKLSETLSGKITTLTAEDLKGVTRILPFRFASCTNLTSVILPESLEEILPCAFSNCPITSIKFPSSLKNIGEPFDSGAVYDLITNEILNSTETVNIDGSALKKDTYIRATSVLKDTGWFTNIGDKQALMGENDSILFLNTKGSTEIPESVRNIVGNAIHDLDTTITSLVIPDWVEIIGGDICDSTSLTKCTIGSNVHLMGVYTMANTTITTWIFRQPEGMEVTLPAEAGQYKGLAYGKSARTIDIYTDNECIINYDWSGDNITANIYPLADAPTD